MDLAELSSVKAQVEELGRRVRNSADAAIGTAAELAGLYMADAEHALREANKSLERARDEFARVARRAQLG